MPTDQELLDREAARIMRMRDDAEAMYEALGNFTELCKAFENVPLPAALTCRLVEQELMARAIFERIDK